MTLPYPTLAEAAEALQFKSERAFRDWLRQHPQDARGEPYVRAAGQGRVLTWDDVERIRVALACPYGLKTRRRAKRRISIPNPVGMDSKLAIARGEWFRKTPELLAYIEQRKGAG